MKAHPHDIDRKLKEANYKSLGWANGWGEKYPEEIEKCVELKHHRNDVSHNMRGTENTVSCDICKIYYKYDCSD